MCVWCHGHAETPIHTLFTCNFAKKLWGHVGIQKIIPLYENVTVLEVMNGAFKTCSRDRRVMIGLYCLSLWWRRNS